MLLICISVFLLYLNIHYRESVSIEKGVAFSYSIILTLIYLFAITNILSLFNCLDYIWLLISWGWVIVLNGIFILKYNRGVFKRFMAEIVINNIPKYFYLYVIVFIIMLIIGFCIAPCNYDSFTYHLPRIVYWANNKSVNHYAVRFYLQLAAPPLVEYLQLHVYILSRYSDLLLTMVQGIACIGASYLIFDISRNIGCNQIWSGIAVLLFVSTPIVAAESLNTQNDVVVAMVFLCFTRIVIAFNNYLQKSKDKRMLFFYSVMIGSGVGLSFISKDYTLLPLFVTLVWLFLRGIKRNSFLNMVLSYIVIGISALMFVVPDKIRMYLSSGHLFISGLTSDQVVNTVDPRLLLICFLKNLFFNLPSHYVYGLKSFFESIVINVASILNVDVNDPHISLYDRYLLNEPFNYSHNGADNMLIISLYLICLVIFVVLKLRKKKVNNVGFLVCPFVSITFFFFVLRYTPFRTRYEIVYFAFLCPAISFILQNMLEDKKSISLVCRTLIVGICVCEMLNCFLVYSEECKKRYFAFNEPESYFGADEVLYTKYLNACDIIHYFNAEKIGLNIDQGLMEYPILVMLNNNNIEYRNVQVGNATEKYEDTDYVPDCIIYMSNNDTKKVGDVIRYNGFLYEVEYEDDTPFDAIAVRMKNE